MHARYLPTAKAWLQLKPYPHVSVSFFTPSIEVANHCFHTTLPAPHAGRVPCDMERGTGRVAAGIDLTSVQSARHGDGASTSTEDARRHRQRTRVECDERRIDNMTFALWPRATNSMMPVPGEVEGCVVGERVVVQAGFLNGEVETGGGVNGGVRWRVAGNSPGLVTH